MKKIYLLVSFLLFAQIIWGQLDTTFQKTKTETGSFEQQLLVDAKNSFLQMQSDEKQVFRLGVERLSFPQNSDSRPGFPNFHGIFIAYERRLKTGFALNTQLGYSRAINIFIVSPIHDVYIYTPKTHSCSISITPRWYFNKKRHITNKKSGNNFNGAYIGLLVGAKHWWMPSTSVNTSDGRSDKANIKGNSQFSTINIGWQRRFDKHGFLHFQLGTGISHDKRSTSKLALQGQEVTLPPLSKWKWINNYSVGLGVAFGGKNEATFDNPIWEYHKEDADMWKIDLFSIFPNLSHKSIAGKINVGYEKRSGQSPFSITANILYVYQYYKFPKLENFFDQLIFQLAPRYYYNLKNRIKKGKTGNNLSADYISIRNQWGIDYSNPNLITYDRDKKYSFSLLWGMQRRIFKHTYVDYQIGYDFKSRRLSNDRTRIINGFISSDLRIGLAF